MIISGNKIARAIRDELKERVEAADVSMSVHIFIVGDDPVIENFVMKKKQFAKKLGIAFVEHRCNAGVSQDALIEHIQQVSKMLQMASEAHNAQAGIVVQLPLPSHIDTQTVLDTVPTRYDIDGLATGSDYIEPVAGAVHEILVRKNIATHNKKALVVGNGKLVGAPVARLLAGLGAKVTIVDETTTHEELTTLCKASDIIVSGAGVPNLIVPEMLSRGVALLDAGTSTQAGSVVGDIAYSCKDTARYFARTPGGIGPVTVAVLFKNLVTKKWKN